VDEVKASESNVGFDSESELEKGRWIIDAEPIATVYTTKIQPGEPDEPISFTYVGERHSSALLC
jgi:hypothetical protein